MACDNGTCFNVGCGWGDTSQPCSCGGNCSNACSSCWGGCEGCDGCSGCGSGCASSCTGGCKNGCSNTCTNGCSGSCVDGCAYGCTNGCTSCDTGCISTEATDLYNALVSGLNKKIMASDISNISKLVQLEANRRSIEATLTESTVKSKATSSHINDIQSVLSDIGYTTTIEVNKENKIVAAVGRELIDKTLSANEETLTHNTIK